VSAAAHDRRDRAFAYVVLICAGPDPDDSSHRSYAEILDGFFEAEASGADASRMWPFGWGAHMRRLAPVQLSGNQDLRNDALRLLGSPKFRLDHPAVFGGSVMFFPAPQLLSAFAPPVTKDAARFVSVVTASIELAQRRDLGEGLLFAGGWGWYDGAELAPEQQVTLMAAGFPHVDRRVP
jgi:hypothetical protein